MSLLLIYCNTASTADSIVTDVRDGALFSVDMGTTSKASSYSRWALVECTENRANSILAADYDREDIEVNYYTTAPDSFTEADSLQKLWYLRGLLA
tara:strand:+ start:191 stop:478 length:288 start_codon:yes stop_codon:yes gene_type:complete